MGTQDVAGGEALRIALEGVGDGFYDWDVAAGAVYYSAGWQRMLGYAPGELGSSPGEWEARIHPDDRAHVSEAYAPHLRGEAPSYRSEYRLRARDGRYIWVLDRGTIVARAPDGAPLRVVGTNSDITAQRELAERLRRSEASFRAMFRLSPVATALTSLAEGRLIDVNDAFVRLTKRSREDLLGRTTAELGLWPGTAARERFVDVLRSEGRVVAYPTSFVLTGGELVEVLLSADLVDTDAGLQMLTTATDVSAIAEAHRRERENDDRLGFTLEATGAGTYEVELDTGAFRRSANYDKLVGVPPGADWSVRSIFDVVHPDDRERLIMAFDERKQGLFSVEFRILRPDGTHTWLRNRGRMLSDEQGVVRRILGVMEDVTAEKEAVLAQQQLREQLLQAQKMEAIGTLAGGVAHDFNNLLAAVLGGLSLIEAQAGDRAGLREVLAETKAAVSRGADLTKQLLGFARRGRYDARPLEIGALVNSTARLFARTRPDLEIAVSAGPVPLVVTADEGQLEHVLLNLFINAGQALPRGGRIDVGLTGVQVEPPAAAGLGVAPGDYVQLTVADDGEGMDEATRARVFEPFFSARPGGSGLGLASVFGVVKNHAGAVGVVSTPGEGTTFTILLPRSDQLPAPVRAAEGRPLPGTETLLFVDDDAAVRASFTAALRACGYDVLAAADRAAGLAVFRERHAEVAVLILDVVMPGMSAREMVEAAFAVDPRARVLLVSGHGAQDEIARLLHRDRVGFLGKPFDVAALTHKVRAMLDG